jgi:DUF4097 and DUF4098 domain-containing protein YvlB
MILKAKRMSKGQILFIVLFLAAGLQMACNRLPMETITDMETSYEGITKINVTGGALEISYTGGDETNMVNLNAFVEATDSDMDGVVVRREGAELFVDFQSGGDFSFFSSFNVEGFINLTGPVDMAMIMNNSSGTMEVTNVANDEIVLRGSSGMIEGKDLRSSDLRVSISSGKAELNDIEGALNFEISSGMGTLKGMKGDVNFKCSSGLMRLSDIEGLLNGKMSSGKADLSRVQELGEISLSSGMLEADQCGFGTGTKLSASSGYMHVNTTSILEDFNFDFKVGSGSLSIGDKSSSDDLYINNNAAMTINGKLQSGKMVISD